MFVVDNLEQGPLTFLKFLNLQKPLLDFCSLSVPIDEDNDDGGGAIPRAD